MAEKPQLKQKTLTENDFRRWDLMLELAETICPLYIFSISDSTSIIQHQDIKVTLQSLWLMSASSTSTIWARQTRTASTGRWRWDGREGETTPTQQPPPNPFAASPFLLPGNLTLQLPPACDWSAASLSVLYPQYLAGCEQADAPLLQPPQRGGHTPCRCDDIREGRGQVVTLCS